MRKVLVLSVLMVLSGLPARAWIAQNGLVVNPTGRPGEVVVEFRNLLDITDYWCAAGDYVIRAMGMSPKTRLYRSNAPRAPGQGYKFTINEADSTPTSGISTFGKDRDDASLSAGHASGGFCRRLPMVFL